MWRIGTNPVVLWSAFVLVHLWLGILNLYGPGLPMGDVTLVYKYWTDEVFIQDFWVGINSTWVYPILAIFPMLAAGLFGAAHYASTWLSMIFLLDAAAFFVLIGWRAPVKRASAGWFWIMFLALLGPIALGRIDSVTVPIAMIAVLIAAQHPRVAALILTVAAWIKVWPAAIVLAMVVALRERWRILGIAIGGSAIIIVLALASGSGLNVLSFFTQQADRGLQVESPVSTIWLWRAFASAPGTYVYYDQRMLTWQVTGDGVGAASQLMTPLMAIVVVAIILSALLARRNGAAEIELLAPLSLALVSALICFNKVGSPQFIAWLAVPIVLGLVTEHSRDQRRMFVAPALLAAIVAGLTQLIYPYLYGWLLILNPFMLVALTLRNGLMFVLLGWALSTMWSLGRRAKEGFDPLPDGSAERSAWPLSSPRGVTSTEPV